MARRAGERGCGPLLTSGSQVSTHELHDSEEAEPENSGKDQVRTGTPGLPPTPLPDSSGLHACAQQRPRARRLPSGSAQARARRSPRPALPARAGTWGARGEPRLLTRVAGGGAGPGAARAPGYKHRPGGRAGTRARGGARRQTPPRARPPPPASRSPGTCGGRSRPLPPSPPRAPGARGLRQRSRGQEGGRLRPRPATAGASRREPAPLAGRARRSCESAWRRRWWG